MTGHYTSVHQEGAPGLAPGRNMDVRDPLVMHPYGGRHGQASPEGEGL